MSKIKEIHASEIIDSRGNPTIETTVVLQDGLSAKSSIASGDSRVAYEAAQLYDGDPNRYQGTGVLKSVANVNEIIGPKISGMEVTNQQTIDKAMIELDGTQNKGKLGANGILSVSQAVTKAAAKSSLLPTYLYIRQLMQSNVVKKMPAPMFNLLEGGKHGWTSLNFQEFLLIPATSKSFSEGLEMGISIYRALKKTIYEKSQNTLVADEGGFSPDLASNEAGLVLLKEAIERGGYSYSLDAFLGLDCCARSFIDGKLYKIRDRAIPYTPEDFVEFYQNLVTSYSLIYLEDPFAEDDWEGWKKVHEKLSEKTLIIGDDLVATNPYRLQLALDNNVVGGIVIKPTQIGTVTESLAVIEIARYKMLKIIVSGRSGETEDTFIADFAVGAGADYVKFGAPARERAVKYNKLLEIESVFDKI